MVLFSIRDFYVVKNPRSQRLCANEKPPVIRLCMGYIVWHNCGKCHLCFRRQLVYMTSGHLHLLCIALYWLKVKPVPVLELFSCACFEQQQASLQGWRVIALECFFLFLYCVFVCSSVLSNLCLSLLLMFPHCPFLCFAVKGNSWS